MARKAKEILLARGYTEADLKSMETLLKDTKFCAAIEAEAEAADAAAALAEERKALLEEDQKWYKEYATPEIEKAREDAIAANKKLAAAEAELISLQKYGLRKIAEGEGHDPDPDPNPKPSPTPTFDESKFLKTEDFQKAYGAVPYSLAMLQDVADQHRELFGKSIPGGTTKLVTAWDNARSKEHYKGSLMEYWEKSYKVADRRAELEKTAKEAYEKELIDKGYNKRIEEEGTNPNLRVPVSSRSPFTKRVATTGDDGKPVPNAMPWDKTREQRSNDRVSKFTTKALQSSVQ